LQAAAAAEAEEPALRIGAGDAFAEYPRRETLLEGRLAAVDRCFDRLSRQCAFDEPHLAVMARNALAFLVQGLDLQRADRRRSRGPAAAAHQAVQRDRTSCQCGCLSLPSAVRTAASCCACWAGVSAPRISWKRR